MNTALYYLLAFAAGTIWGTTFSLARIATEAGYHPIGLSWWQAIGGCVVLLPWCLWRNEFRKLESQPRSSQKPRHNPQPRPQPRPQPKPQPTPQLSHMALVGITGNVIPATLLFYAAVYVPAGVLAITIAIVPMLTYAVSVALSLDRFSTRRVSGVLLGFIAIVLIMLPDSVEVLPDSPVGSTLTDSRLWIAAALFAGIFYTIENIFVDARVPRGTSMPVLLCGGMLIAALLLLPLVVLNGAFVKLTVPLNRAEWSIIAMMFASSIAYLMYLTLIKLAGAVFASMSGYVVTLSGVLWGIVIFNESHSTLIWIALLLMLLGMGLVTPRKEVPTEKGSATPDGLS